MAYFNKKCRYEQIIKLLCMYKGIEDSELISILKDEDCKHLLFLLLNKYGCIYEEKLKKDFEINTTKHINKNLEKAQQKLLINKRIREMYFEAENIIGEIKIK